MVMHTNTLDIHKISAIKGVDKHKNMPICTVDTHNDNAYKSQQKY